MGVKLYSLAELEGPHAGRGWRRQDLNKCSDAYTPPGMTSLKPSQETTIFWQLKIQNTVRRI